MAVYKYRGTDPGGQPIQSIIEADNKQQATEILKNRRIAVREIKRDLSKVEIGLPEKINDEDVLISTRQLSVMVDAGLPIVKALDIIATQASKKRMRKIFMDVKGGIETGSEFNKALGRYKNDFGELYVNMIAAGEAGGLLDSILERLANYLEKSISLKRKVKAAMTYPTVVLIVAVAVVYGLMVFIIPKFKEMYEGFGGELPALTQLAISISDFLSKWYGGGLIFASIIVSFTVLKLTYKRSPAGRYKMDQIFLRIPKIGDLIRKVAVAKFSRTFGTLLSSGVSILDALDIVAKTSGNKVIEKALLDSKRDIESGKTIVEPLEKSGVFPSMVIQMISVGEETGSLDLMLQKIADFYDDEVDRSVEGLTKLIEPFLMLFVGGAVGFVIIAMYLPIFKLGDVIQ
ncbi:type II secretion system F family protein [Geovibrio thiophilus]|uniref:Type II secretion system F family protein n=1 Tax=Geovibrio thiophilus TaxID=139438 RepID=A0A410JY56_9BACT|nr:type II secretion system F family protein [Geovibrio thiophilus]QAR33073.1 type II secretion system F family protein [Geovibrio thiophilus]